MIGVLAVVDFLTVFTECDREEIQDSPCVTGDVFPES